MLRKRILLGIVRSSPSCSASMDTMEAAGKGGGSNSTGCTYFLISFFETEGYVFRSPTEDEMKEALIISKEMAEWPANDSISFRNDIIIVKLS